MYRLVLREQVIYGHFKEYLGIVNEMKAYEESKGWASSTFMSPVVGTGNEVVFEFDYESLDAFEKEGKAVMMDPEFMKLVRRASEHIVQGMTRSELLETVTDVA
jgi:hypothetical protein